MINILQILQIVSAVLLILLVIVHSPKGEGIGGICGASQLFSSQKGAEAGLNKLTSIVAIAFTIISLILSLMTYVK